MAWCTYGDELDQDIFDAVTEFVGQLLQSGETLAEKFGVPLFCIKAIHRLDEPVTMKELARRMGCDKSFVTMVADVLETRGLARREPNAADRRLKNLTLTPDGLELKARLEQAIIDQMPWSRALDAAEQESLLAMMRKMNNVPAGPSAPSAGGNQAGEVSAGPAVASRPQRDLRSEAVPARPD